MKRPKSHGYLDEDLPELLVGIDIEERVDGLTCCYTREADSDLPKAIIGPHE